jgi:hypothetical protein
MANDKIFTMPLAASSQYVISDETSALGITIVNDTASASDISITGTTPATINGVYTAPSAVTLAKSETISLTSSSPLSLIIDVAAGTTGKLILIK